MWILHAMEVAAPLLLVGLLVLAVLRPRTKQTWIVVGLALCILGYIPELPGISSALVRALYRPEFADPGSRPPSNFTYYFVFGLARALPAAGATLFGWAALTSSAREGRQVSAPQWGGAGQQSAWTPAPSGWAGNQEWTPAAQPFRQQPGRQGTAPQQGSQAAGAPASPAWSSPTGAPAEQQQWGQWQQHQSWQGSAAPHGQSWQPGTSSAAPRGQTWQQAGSWQGQPAPQGQPWSGNQGGNRNQGDWQNGEWQQGR